MIAHPKHLINSDHVSIIRQQAVEAESLGKLTPKQLQLVYEQGWFRISVPKQYGGLQMPLPEIVRLQEALSWCDGSFGWVITLCSGAGWFGGFIEPTLAAAIFSNNEVCLAGSGASTGTAEMVDGGYIINGNWHYASGVHHATHITANCVITRQGKTMLGKDEKPLIKPFVLDKQQVTVLPGWKYMGMIATGSDAYEINNAFADDRHCFTIDGAKAVIDDKLYRYPFLQLAYATLAINLSGMAIHFMDLCSDIIEQKLSAGLPPVHAKILQDVLPANIQRLNDVRISFFNALNASWNNITATDLLHNVSVESYQLAKTALRCTDELYPFCGLKAAGTGTDINRVWRDIHTASQHSLLTFAPLTFA